MKKILACLTFATLFASCDPGTDIDYYIVNNCDESIKVNYRIEGDGLSVNVESKKVHFLGTDGYLGEPGDKLLGRSFAYITIIKGNDTSKIDYRHSDWLWEVSNIKKVGLAGYKEDATLTVNPSDFEN